MGKKKVVKKIKIDCAYNDVIELDALYSIQENLKVPHDLPRLKESIVRNNIKFPLFIWHDKVGKMYKIIDGHHRVAACKELRDEGYDIQWLPVVYINCANHKEAKEHVLRGTARYTVVGKKDFQRYTEDAGLDLINLSEELSSKTYGYLEELIIEPDDLGKAKSEGIKELGGRKPAVGGDTDYSVLQLVFNTPEESEQFWKLMTRIRNFAYKRDDYKDVLLAVIQKECRLSRKKK